MTEHGGPAADARAVTRTGFLLGAEAGSRHQIVVTGRTEGGERWVPGGYTMAAVNARHLLVSKRARGERSYDIEYLLAPIRTWKGDPRIAVRVTYPSAWRLAVGGPTSPGWARTRAGESDVLTRTMSAKEAALLALAIDVPESKFHNGGPLLAIGGTVGATRGVRGRIGYEVAAPEWLLYSATVDTDFRKRFIVTPMVEAATPVLIVIPSFGLGVGAPIQLAPDRRVGVRIQGDLHLYAVGFVTSVDVYPAFGAKLPGFTEVSLLGQVGF